MHPKPSTPHHLRGFPDGSKNGADDSEFSVKPTSAENFLEKYPGVDGSNTAVPGSSMADTTATYASKNEDNNLSNTTVPTQSQVDSTAAYVSKTERKSAPYFYSAEQSAEGEADPENRPATMRTVVGTLLGQPSIPPSKQTNLRDTVIDHKEQITLTQEGHAFARFKPPVRYKIGDSTFKIAAIEGHPEGRIFYEEDEDGDLIMIATRQSHGSDMAQFARLVETIRIDPQAFRADLAQALGLPVTELTDADDLEEDQPLNWADETASEPDSNESTTLVPGEHQIKSIALGLQDEGAGETEEPNPFDDNAIPRTAEYGIDEVSTSHTMRIHSGIFSVPSAEGAPITDDPANMEATRDELTTESMQQKIYNKTIALQEWTEENNGEMSAPGLLNDGNFISLVTIEGVTFLVMQSDEGREILGGEFSADLKPELLSKIRERVKNADTFRDLNKTIRLTKDFQQQMDASGMNGALIEKERIKDGLLLVVEFEIGLARARRMFLKQEVGKKSKLFRGTVEDDTIHKIKSLEDFRNLSQTA